jgi:hypothetical protein
MAGRAGPWWRAVGLAAGLLGLSVGLAVVAVALHGKGGTSRACPVDLGLWVRVDQGGNHRLDRHDVVPTPPGKPQPTWKVTAMTDYTTTNQFDCTGRPDGNYANPADPSTYFACSGGIAYLLHCPEGLHFNPATDQCDDPEIAGA